jgi:hypothetical protein
MCEPLIERFIKSTFKNITVGKKENIFFEEDDKIFLTKRGNTLFPTNHETIKAGENFVSVWNLIFVAIAREGKPKTLLAQCYKEGRFPDDGEHKRRFKPAFMNFGMSMFRAVKKSTVA